MDVQVVISIGEFLNLLLTLVLHGVASVVFIFGIAVALAIAYAVLEGSHRLVTQMFRTLAESGRVREV